MSDVQAKIAKAGHDWGKTLDAMAEIFVEANDGDLAISMMEAVEMTLDARARAALVALTPEKVTDALHAQAAVLGWMAITTKVMSMAVEQANAAPAAETRVK